MPRPLQIRGKPRHSESRAAKPLKSLLVGVKTTNNFILLSSGLYRRLRSLTGSCMELRAQRSWVQLPRRFFCDAMLVGFTTDREWRIASLRMDVAYSA